MNAGDYRVLIVDDQIGKEGAFRDSFLERAGLPPDRFVFCTGQDSGGHNSPETVIRQVEALWSGTSVPKLSLVLLDIYFEDREDAEGGKFGLKLLGMLRERFGRALPVVMLTAVEAVREEANTLQADGFLPKESLTKGVLEAQLFRTGLYPEDDPGVSGTSPAFLQTLREVRRAMASGIREILLVGETGTGKTELAKYMHRISGRTGPFVTWYGRRNNSDLHFDQLFGHWRNAFTGASEHHAGAAERAHLGTLFIDEIGELGPDTQTDLLEYRQRKADGLRRINRLGNTPPGADRADRRTLNLTGTYSGEEDRILVDTILVSATNKPVDDADWRRESGFRDDLFTRLGHTVRMPPLRERTEDIVPLFLSMASQAAGRQLSLAPGTRQMLETHEWREGNIAELRRAAEMAATKLGPDFSGIQPHHFDILLAAAAAPSRSRSGGTGTAAGTASAAGVPPDAGLPVTGDSYLKLEIRSLAGLAEHLRTAVIDTRRPTGLGSLADIMKRATGVLYSATDVKREVKDALAPWFAPNGRQKSRWERDPDYLSQAERIRGDIILSSLYRYSADELGWEAARTAILADLDGKQEKHPDSAKADLQRQG